MLEFSFVISSNQRLKEGSRLACRIASRPCADPHVRDMLMRDAIEDALGRQALIDNYDYYLKPGRFTGDSVVVVAQLPMHCASPDLLAPLGFRLAGRKLVARTVMRME